MPLGIQTFINKYARVVFIDMGNDKKIDKKSVLEFNKNLSRLQNHQNATEPKLVPPI